jgi:polar amino acid transport system permease protein
MTYVTFPQALRLILPPTGNELNIMFKTTSLVSVIGITELLRESQLVAETSRSPLGTYFAALVYYLVLTTLWGAVQGWLESRYAHRTERRSFLAVWWGGLTGNVASGP